MRRSSRVARFEDYGDVSRIRLDEESPGAPGPGEVLIEVVASGVSHMDAYVREGRFRDAVPLTFPARQGVSFAGVVRAQGEGVRAPHVGAEVMGHDPAHGAHADLIVVPAGSVVRKPEVVPWEVAGALYLVGLTAYSTVQSLRPSPGDVIVVTAAAGGVGHLECQLLRLGGARVIGIAGEENHDYLRQIGAVPVRYGDGLAERVREAALGDPVTGLIDNYGDYAWLAGEVGLRPPRFVSTEARRDLEIRYYNAPGDDREAAIQLRDVAELVATWNIRVLVSGFYALDNVQQAMVDLDARHSRGVVVLGMHPAASPGEYLRDKLRGVYQRL
jgi:D-arabinose 1-dehydrogenase-like Zn-dependent alcohol dehydrogenase